MIEETEALRRILAAITSGPTEQLPLASALNRFAVEDVLAGVPNPPFDNSAMDGYALRAADSSADKSARVTGEQPAGLDRHLNVEAGCAIRIFTGAPVPSGADAVIMQEDVEVQSDGSIRCIEPVITGENIRRTGADLCRGQRILAKGDRFTAGRIGLLASQGLDSIEAVASPRIAVLSTGDEVAKAGSNLLSGQIYNSNGPMLHALLLGLGITNVTVEHCSDDFTATEQTISRLLSTHDFLIIAGGVSVGEHDQIKPALYQLGLAPDLWRVKMKPGKPFLFCLGSPRGDAKRTVNVFGLPGNPVSAFVTFHVFVRPALLKWLGAAEDEITSRTALAEITSPITNKGDRPHYLRGRVTAGKFQTQGAQESHAIFGLSHANALLRLEPNEIIDSGSLRQVTLL